MHGMRPLGDLLPVDEALARLLARAPVLDEGERVALHAADGRVTRVPIATRTPLPPFDRATMDGYAFAANGATRPGARLRLLGASHAGAPFPDALGEGQAVRIATGAALPSGADAVMPVERTHEEGDEVVLGDASRPGRYVEAEGSEVAAGGLLVPARTRLGPAHVGLLAAGGHAEVEVVRRPRVALLATGDELTPPEVTLRRGEIHESNGVALAALLRAHGADARVLPRVPDRETATRAAFADATARHDLVLTTGGASAGERDHARDAIGAVGEVLFHGVRLKPGKPVLGAVAGRCVVLGLPGNPVSALVTAHLFALPLVRRLLGIAEPPVPFVHARAAARIEAVADRDMVMPVALRDGGATATFVGSGALRSLTASDGYVWLRAGERIEEGDAVEVRPW